MKDNGGEHHEVSCQINLKGIYSFVALLLITYSDPFTAALEMRPPTLKNVNQIDASCML